MRLKLLYSLLVLLGCLAGGEAAAQQPVDSIYFHLYTDSLKKGVHNYINVDAKLRDGRWLPLTARELNFTSTAGRFEQCNLILDTAFKGEKVTVKASLKRDPQIWREVTIYLKTVDTVERLRTVEEILQRGTAPASRNRRNKRG